VEKVGACGDAAQGKKDASTSSVLSRHGAAGFLHSLWWRAAADGRRTFFRRRETGAG
jgi:hypothetical protein